MEKMAGKYSFVSQDKFKDWLKAEGTVLKYSPNSLRAGSCAND